MATTQNAQRDVEAMLERGVPFEHIEGYIEGRRDLSGDQRSALWLLAWCETSEDRRRGVVASILTDLEHMPRRRLGRRRKPTRA